MAEMEYIEREAVLKMLNRYFQNLKGCEAQILVSDIKHGALELPTADVVEVVHGVWINKNGLYRCSECDSVCPYDIEADVYDLWTCHYCPNCGAKMDGKGDK